MYKAIVNDDTYVSILEPRHSRELFQLVDSSRDSISEWLSFPSKTNSEGDSKLFIEKSLNRFANNNGYWSGIWYQDRLVGSIGFLYIDWSSKKTEIGYWLGKEFEGKGLVTNACKLFIKHAFEDLHLNKVETNIATKNDKSRAIPERLGFKEEGVIRDFEYLNGEYLDRVFYGLLKDEWSKQSK